MIEYNLILNMDLKRGGKYKIGKKLGSGAFGEAFHKAFLDLHFILNE